MGFSLNKISPITFDIENPQTPADHGIKSRAPTSTPRERGAPQTNKEAANPNEAHHEPQENTLYNPDDSIITKNIQGRFVPPKAENMVTQPQQQSLSEEGGKENTILDRPRSERSAPGHPSGSADKGTTRTSPYSTHITNWRTTTGSPSQQSK